LCGEELTPPLPGTPPPPPPGQAGGPLTYSLSTLFLIVTLAGVCFGLIAAAPVLGIPVTVLIVPALIRTFTTARRQQARGERPTAEEKIGSFFASMGLILAIVMGAAIAFFAACSVVGFGLAAGIKNPDSPAGAVMIYLALVAGLVAAVTVGVWGYIYDRKRSKK
jgi:hypothetical protein